MSTTTQEILDDGGWLSRKYVALYVYWVAISSAFVASAYVPSLAALFPSYWAGLSAGLAAYFGVNWGHSYLAQRAEQNYGDYVKPSNWEAD